VQIEELMWVRQMLSFCVKENGATDKFRAKKMIILAIAVNCSNIKIADAVKS